MGGSCGLVPVILVLILTVTRIHARCTEQELFTIIKCILPYNAKFLQIFGARGSCKRVLISEDVCSDFSAIVDCANQKNISRTACLPLSAKVVDQILAIPCKVTDFKELCDEASSWNVGTGKQAQCTVQELLTLIECLDPYTQKFIKIFGFGKSCNRALISENVCKDFAAIVFCANKKIVSRTTCRPYVVEQIDQQSAIPCKMKDFKEACRRVPAVNIGGAGAAGASILLGAAITVSLICSGQCGNEK